MIVILQVSLAKLLCGGTFKFRAKAVKAPNFGRSWVPGADNSSVSEGLSQKVWDDRGEGGQSQITLSHGQLGFYSRANEKLEEDSE